MTYVLGLTGSIGMGKSTTAAFFAEQGIPVWDADAAVHRLYSQDQNAIDQVTKRFPNALVDGVINRAALSAYFKQDHTALSDLDAIVHPLVAANRACFIKSHEKDALVVLDVPLIFETGIEDQFDGILVVSAPMEIQKARVMARPKMTEEWFEMVLSKQVPDAEKRAKADFVIETKTLDDMRKNVVKLIEQLTGQASNA